MYNLSEMVRKLLKDMATYVDDEFDKIDTVEALVMHTLRPRIFVCIEI
jgi:hypothetical protein